MSDEFKEVEKKGVSDPPAAVKPVSPEPVKPVVKELTKDDLANLAKRPVRELDLPALGRKVYWRPLNAAEQVALESVVEFIDGEVDPETLRRIPARKVASHLCDATGKRLYGPDELDSLADADWSLIEPIHVAIRSQSTGNEVLKN